MPPKLLITTGDESIEIVCRELTTIGRVKPNDVVVADPRVSRSHAMVRMLGDGRFYLMDVGSVNGTYVNDQRVVVPRELKDGDQIRVGSHVITFCSEPADASDAVAEREEETDSRTVQTMGKVVALLTILVVDVRGYTALSETLPAERLASVMGAFFNEATRAVQANGGSVDKFIGDAVMARWTADRKTLPASVVAALRTAQEMHNAVERINSGPEALPTPLRIGCGINSGLAVLGTLGAKEKREYTALGDSINLAFRLETATKELGTDLAVGFDSCRRLPEGCPWQPQLKTITVKGKTEPVQVWPLAFAELEGLLAELAAAGDAGATPV